MVNAQVSWLVNVSDTYFVMRLFSLSAFEDEFLLSHTFSIKRRLLLRNLPFYQGLLTLKGQNYEKN
jgi:hypothetical protein